MLNVFAFIFSTLLPLQGEPASEDFLTQYLSNIPLTEHSSGLELVDSIYIINLNERPEKWQKMQELFLPQGFSINRMPAINGKKMPLQIQEKLKSYSSNRLSEGQIGCFLSHLAVIRDAYQRGFSIVWILEDDVDFLEDPHQFSNLLAKLSKFDPEWDVFYTDLDTFCLFNTKNFPLQSGKTIFPENYYKRRILIDKDIMKIRARYGMYSYFISRNGMKKILENLTHCSSLWSSIDHEIHLIPGLRQYSSTREIVTVADLHHSDTGSFGFERIKKDSPLRALKTIKDQASKIKYKNNLIFCFIFVVGFLTLFVIRKK